MGPRLFKFELTWANAAFDAIFPAPPHSALAHGIDKMHPAVFFDAVVARAPMEQAIGLRIALWIVALAPFFAIHRLATISSLPAGDRPRVIERLLVSPIYAVRQLVLGFKAMGALLYAQSPAVYAQMIAPSAPLLTLRPKRSDPPPPPAQGGSSNEHAAE
jgi:hypothetical protein